MVYKHSLSQTHEKNNIIIVSYFQHFLYVFYFLNVCFYLPCDKYGLRTHKNKGFFPYIPLHIFCLLVFYLHR